MPTEDPYPGRRTDLECGECGAPMTLRGSKYGPFYGCSRYPACEGTHGAHPDGSPLGVPADELTEKWRGRVHELFDPLWKEHGYEREEAYRLLAERMEIPREETHVAMFDIERCKQAIAALTQFYMNERLTRA